MKNSRRSPFRESAMKQYVQRREQDILPRVVSPPFFIVCWLLLALLMAAGALAWFAEVPTFASASGVVTAQKTPANSTQALVFFPATNAPKLQVGEPIQIQVGSNGPILQQKVTQVEPGALSPSDIRTRFALDAGAAQRVTEPSIVAIVQLDASITAQKYAGTSISAQVQVGLHSVLSQLWSD
jgi:hypothetical protein